MTTAAAAFFEVLSQPRFRVRSLDTVRAKVQNIVAGGASKLMVIADFDQTLTRFKRANGSRNLSSHGVVENCNLLGHEYHDKVHDYYATYYPVEVDPHLTHAQKLPTMVEWWTKAHDALIEAGMKKSFIDDMVKRADLEMRNGCQDVMDRLGAAKVPLLIFSAGLGDVIEGCLRAHVTLPKSAHIVSNFMEFDKESGAAVGFKGQLMHVFNKGDFGVVQGSAFHGELQGRTNVVVLGDGLGDVHMADGVDEAETVLYMGFLNDRVDERLDAFMDAYDIVVLGDGGLEHVTALFAAIPA